MGAREKNWSVGKTEKEVEEVGVVVFWVATLSFATKCFGYLSAKYDTPSTPPTPIFEDI